MNRSMTVTRVGGLLGDPAVYVFFQKSGGAILFDLGDLSPLSNRALLKVRTALVSHTHIDHFIGFDRLLRVHIPHGRLLELIGPSGLIANVAGKLRGYTWNLLEPGQIRIRVHEVDTEGRTTSAWITSDQGFHPQLEAPAQGRVPTVDDGPLAPPPIASIPTSDLLFEAVALDHKTPSIAYACQLPRRLHVKAEALAELGVAPGPWIRELQLALKQGASEQAIALAGRTYRAAELGHHLFVESAARPLGYLTDIGFTRSNVERALALLRGVEHLVAETNYRDGERHKARERMHLTTRQAALIAAASGVSRFEIFHVSHIYAQDPGVVESEARRFFEDFQALSPLERLEEIEAELARVEG